MVGLESVKAWVGKMSESGRTFVTPIRLARLRTFGVRRLLAPPAPGALARRFLLPRRSFASFSAFFFCRPETVSSKVVRVGRMAYEPAWMKSLKDGIPEPLAAMTESREDNAHLERALEYG